MNENVAVVQEPDSPVGFSYTGDGLSLALLMLKNLFLTIITIGIYRAWAKTDMRRYIWGNVVFLGDRGAYTGTGKELFGGWVKLFGILVLVILCVNLLSTLIKLVAFVTPIAYVFIFAVATYSGLRYRMSRTLWRNIRFGVDRTRESTRDYLKLYLLGVFLSAITFSIYYPWFKNHTRKFLTDKSRFGSAYFKYDGDAGEYAAIYWKSVLFFILTFGIYTPWMILNLERYRLEHTSFQGRRFKLTLEGRDLLVYGLCAYFASIFTLGIAAPWMYNWGLKLFIENIHLTGSPNFEGIQNLESDGNAMGDDLLAAYDIDLGI